MSAGNLEAIRDWSNRYFYKKSEVNEFFMKINAGLKAYKLTLLSSKNATINIVENVASNPQTYSVQTDRSGTYTGLFFFSAGSSITCTCGSKTATVTLTDSVMTINVNEYVIVDLISTAPIMDDPHILESSRFDSDHSGFRAFDKGASNREFVTAENNSPSYIGYHFDSSVILTSLKTYTSSNTSSGSRTVLVQGSNDGNMWNDLSTIVIQVRDSSGTTYNIPSEMLLPFNYIRLYENASWRPANHSISNPQMALKLYFYGYIPD